MEFIPTERSRPEKHLEPDVPLQKVRPLDMDVKFLINTPRYFDRIPHPHNFELCTNVSYMRVHAFGLFSTQNHLNEKFSDYFSFTSLTIRTDPRSFPTSSIMPTPPSLTSPYRTLTQATILLPGGA